MNRIDNAIQILKQGGIGIFPTDTAFGIGCKMTDIQAVKRLFQIRKRPFSQATPVLVNSIEMAESYWQRPLPLIVKDLLIKYWPGALTVVIPCLTKKIPNLVRGGKNNLGLRWPDHEITVGLINGVGESILGPSANFHTLPTPFRYKDLDKNFIKLVDFVLEGECKLQKISTVIDCSIMPFKIIRQGAVNIT